MEVAAIASSVSEVGDTAALAWQRRVEDIDHRGNPYVDQFIYRRRADPDITEQLVTLHEVDEGCRREPST